MKELIHVTKCVCCADNDNRFEISAGAFDPIPIAGQSPRTDRFGLELYTHLQKTADKEARRILKAQQTNGHAGQSPDQQTAAQIVLSQGRHIAALQAVIGITQWAQRFALLGAFETTDPEIANCKENARRGLHMVSAGPVPTDGHLRDVALQVIERWQRGDAPRGETDTEMEMLVQSVHEALLQLRDLLTGQTPDLIMPLVTLAH